MNENIQNQINEQNEEANDPENVTASIADLPMLTSDVVARDSRRVDIVEVNFKDGSVRVVESSDAPKITPEILTEKAKPIQSGKAIFDAAPYQVKIRHGKGLALDIEHSRLLDRMKDADPAEKTKAVKHLFLADMVVIQDTPTDTPTPMFSYEGTPDGFPPIEDCSDILLNELWNAYVDVNFPLEDQTYQVTVLRGMPIHASHLLRDTLELYPVRNALTPVSEMGGDAIEAWVARDTAQRQVIVSSMVLDPPLSYNAAGKKGAYPVEDISEGWVSMLYEAYKVVTIPSERLSQLRRFPRLVANGDRKE